MLFYYSFLFFIPQNISYILFFICPFISLIKLLPARISVFVLFQNFWSLSLFLHFFTHALLFSLSSGFCTGLTRSKDFSGQVSPQTALLSCFASHFSLDFYFIILVPCCLCWQGSAVFSYFILRFSHFLHLC